MASVNDALDRFARDFKAGHVLFEEGQPGDLHVRRAAGRGRDPPQGRRDRARARGAAAGEFFGEMAILNGRPRSATAVVRSDVAPARDRGQDVRGDAARAPRDRAAHHQVARAAAREREPAGRAVAAADAEPPRRAVPAPHGRRADRCSPARRSTPGTAILVPKRVEDIAVRVGLPVHEVIDVVDRLRAARLVLLAEDAGIDGDGFIVPEVGRLLEFLEFLNLKDRFGGCSSGRALRRRGSGMTLRTSAGSSSFLPWTSVSISGAIWPSCCDQRGAGRAGQQRRDDRHDERPAPDLADGFAGRGGLNDRESFGFERASDLLALRADFIDDKDRRHRDLTYVRAEPVIARMLLTRLAPRTARESR